MTVQPEIVSHHEGGPRDEIAADSVSVRTADDIARLLAERNLPGGRGCVTWAWILSVPLLAVNLVGTMAVGDWVNFWGSLAAIVTGKALETKAWLADTRRAALLLSDLDREWLGPLIEALTYPTATVRDVARLRLTTLLPALGEGAAEALSPARRALLFDHLTRWNAWRQPDLIRAILRFGAAAGEERALEGTQELARMRTFSVAQRQVRQAARRGLPELEHRIAASAAAERKASTGNAVEAASRDQNRALSPEARSWLEAVDAESARRPAMRFAFLLASWGVMVPYALYQIVNQWREGYIPGVLLALVGGILATQLYRFTLTPQQIRLASKLGSVENVEAVGPLAEMLSWPDERMKSMAIAALTRLLPRLKTSETHLLGPTQRCVLYDMLRLANARRHAEFQIALLKSLEQVGDLDAVPYVRSLAATNPATRQEQRVVAAAAECLPFLEGCAPQNRSSQILLRAATDEARDAALLRPGGRQTEPEPALLVRSVYPPD